MKGLYSLTVLILFIISLSLVSCNDEKTPVELILGKWNYDSRKWAVYLNGVKTNEGTYKYEPGEAAIEFLENGTGKKYNLYEIVVDTITWEVDGDIVTITVSWVGPMEYDFTVTETNLTLKGGTEETIASDIIKSEWEEFLIRIE